MVRFIINGAEAGTLTSFQFTFQYGQIYYQEVVKTKDNLYNIYIPIWLDLLWRKSYGNSTSRNYLHSNMVRFIICISEKRPESEDKFTFQYGQIYYSDEYKRTTDRHQIYIPIWLDLL